MKLLAIVGSYRKGKTIDTLVDRAIEGAKTNDDSIVADKVFLMDKHIEYCKNCMNCKEDDPAKLIARCIIDDDMQMLNEAINEADCLIFGTPVNIGHETAIMKTFLERVCWVHARPGTYPIKGCPGPRSQRKKKAIIIVSSGIVRPLLRRWCDEATPLLKDMCKHNLNAKVVGTLYAGAVEKRGITKYLAKAHKLGTKLTA